MMTTSITIPPCARCGAVGPSTCARTEPQDCLLQLPLNKRYVCRCCAMLVGEEHHRFCKEAQGPVLMAHATDTPIRFEAQEPVGVLEIEASGAHALTFPLRRIIRTGGADDFMALGDEDKRRVFVACAEDSGDIMCMRSLRMSAVMPAVIPELALLVRQLAYALHECALGHPLAEQAMEHLKRTRLDSNAPAKEPAA